MPLGFFNFYPQYRQTSVSSALVIKTMDVREHTDTTAPRFIGASCYRKFQYKIEKIEDLRPEFVTNARASQMGT